MFWRCAELRHCQQQLASAGSWKHFRRIPLSAGFREFVLDVQWMSNWCPGKLDNSRIWTWQVEVRSSHTLPTPTSCASWTWGSSPSFATWLQTLHDVQSCYWRLETNTKMWTYDSVTYKHLYQKRLIFLLISLALPHSYVMNVLWKQLLCLPCGIKGTIFYLIVPSAETGYRRVAGCVTTPPFPVTRLPQCPVPNQWPHPTDMSGHNRWAARFSPSAPFVNEVDMLLRASKVAACKNFRALQLSSRLHPLRMYMDWRHLRDGSPILFHPT